MTLSRKGAKSRTRGRKLRSTGTKAEVEAVISQARQSSGDVQQQLEVSRRELAEARAQLAELLQQQTATADVLKVISRSTFDLQLVLENLLESAVRLCGADRGLVYRHDGDVYRVAASYGHSPEWLEIIERYPIHKDRTSATGRAVLDRRVVHIHDILADSEYRWAEDLRNKKEMHRTILAVPMLREGDIIGVIVIRRTRVQPFTDKQIELATTFADQAVIAIENVRLFDEVQARTRELSEALEQQTATSEVLQVISSSPGDLEPVFQAMLANATRICEAKFGTINFFDGDQFRVVAEYNVPPAFTATRLRQGPFRPHPSSAHAHVIRTKQVVHIEDLTATPPYGQGDPAVTAMADLGGARTIVLVPMLKEGDLLGTMTVFRQEVRPFTDKQIELVTNFAAQAVIAIENTRLLNELRQRTDDLSEALEQQTATSDVLRIISSSPSELEPVFRALLANATRLCEASYGALWLCEGDGYRTAALHGPLPEAYLEQLRPGTVYHPDPEVSLVRATKTRRAVQVADLSATRAYLDRDPLPVAAVDIAGIRTLVSVPMLKESEVVGAIVIYRQEVRSFTDKQIALVTNFAAQAVIAIENTRLLNELRQRTDDLAESLQQQTAASDVLQVISRSAFDLQPVFEAVAESSIRLCGADRAFIFRFDGELLRMVAAYNAPPEFKEWVAQHPIRPGRHSGSARAALERRTIHIPDVRADPEYTYGAKDAEAIRTVLGVPILKGDDLLGVMMIYHLKGVRPFTEKQIALVETFADQAAIAIENVRLFQEIQDKSRQLAEASQHKSQFLANMSHELRTPLNAIIGVTEMLREDAEALKQDVEPLDRVLGAGRHLLALINDILDLSKIEAGRMELNLETFALPPLIDDVVKTIEPLAAKNGNQVVVHCDAAIGTMHADQMRLRQALLNLMSNANKFTEKGTVTIAAHQRQENGRDWITLSVADTGIGMTAEQMGKLFQEFSQAVLDHREQIRRHGPWPRDQPAGSVR